MCGKEVSPLVEFIVTTRVTAQQQPYRVVDRNRGATRESQVGNFFRAAESARESGVHFGDRCLLASTADLVGRTQSYRIRNNVLDGHTPMLGDLAERARSGCKRGDYRARGCVVESEVTRGRAQGVFDSAGALASSR